MVSVWYLVTVLVLASVVAAFVLSPPGRRILLRPATTRWKELLDAAAALSTEDERKFNLVVRQLDTLDSRCAILLALNSLLALAVGVALSVPGDEARLSLAANSELLLLIAVGFWLVAMILCLYGVSRVIWDLEPPLDEKSPLLQSVALRTRSNRVAVYCTWIASAIGFSFVAANAALSLLSGSTGEIRVARSSQDRSCNLFVHGSRRVFPIVETQQQRIALRDGPAEAASSLSTLEPGTNLYVRQACDDWVDVVAIWSDVVHPLSGWVKASEICTPDWFSWVTELSLIAGPTVSQQCGVSRP